YLFERVSAVVVEVRSRLGDVPERRGVQRQPVVTPSTSERMRTDGESREAGEERSAGVRGPLPRDLAVAPCDLVGTRVSQEPWCAGLEDEPRRALPAREVRPVHGTWTLRADGHVADFADSGRIRLPHRAVALGARTSEDGLALRLERVERRIRVRRRLAFVDRGGRGSNAVGGEELILEGGDVVEEALRGRRLDLGVVDEGAERLFLQGRHARIELIAPVDVRTAGPFGSRQWCRIGARQLDVEDGRNAAPDVHVRLRGPLAGRCV